MLHTLIIIPAYNEEDNILTVVENIRNYAFETGNIYDVLVVNDGSNDRTGVICDENDINVIHLIHNLGIGGAVQTGYKYAYYNNYDIAVQFDGDGQHEVSDIEKITKPIREKKADFVIGSRFVDATTSEFKSSFYRRLGIKIISFFIKLVTREKVMDTTSGFRAVNKDIIARFFLSYPVEYPEPITTTELLRQNYTLMEIAVQMHERDGGVSSIKAWMNIYYMVNVIITILVIGVRRYHRVK